MTVVKQVFVMMPSGNYGEYDGGEEESDYIYDAIICPALRAALDDCVNIVRETDNRKPGAITRELIRHIAEADICIVDITGLNANVFLELGVRYALRRSTTILLRQNGVALPFDITDYRCIEYSARYKGPSKARGDIAATVASALESTSRGTDSLVFNAIPDLRVDIPGIVDWSESAENTIMPWDVYWQQFEAIVNRIKDVVKDGIYVPQAVLGISNGGLIYADLLGRHVFQGIPILSLWADRVSRDQNFFDHAVNDGVVASIEKRGEGSATKTVLLVDDIVASGTTLGQAIKYLKKTLPDWAVYFLPLFSRNEKYYDIIKEDMIWAAPAFRNKVSPEEVPCIHAAEIAMLPYKKEIRST